VSVLPWIGAGAYELGRRAISNPWFWNALQLFLWGEQEYELHDVARTLREQQHAAGEQQQIPGAPQGCVWPPRVGSGEWYDLLETMENEMAMVPRRYRGHIGDYY
jgi:hypothetical protein